MKLIYKIFAAAASILALSSCVENAIEPMTGKYEKPVVYEMNTLASQSVEKGDKNRTFTVELSGDNASMTLKMVSDKYFLADGSYTPAPADQAKKNTYIVGNGGTTFNNIPVETGSIKVTQGEGTYSFAGILWLADESVIEVKSTVALVYEADPEPVKPLNMSDVVTPVADATGAPVAGVEKHNITLTEGEATVAIFELLTAEGADIAGTYTCQEYASAAGLMGNGYSFPDWGIEGGSRYWVDGQLVLINAGETLEVTKVSEGVYKFVGSTGYEFTATAGNGGAPESDYTEFSKLLIYQPNQETDANYQPTGRYTSLTLKMGTEGMYTEVVNNGYFDETKIKGNGQVLSIDFYTADGTLAAGTYEACAEGGVVGEGEFGIGYDVEMWGQQMVWGTCVTPYENDAEGAIQKITDGTITVEVSGDVYTITLESSAVNARYVGPMTL